jgi:tripartite-type tricarboxylate transporter receptor subunit TctC
MNISQEIYGGKAMLGKSRYIIAFIATALLNPALSRAAEDADLYYKGKEIHLLISHPAGGGMDTYARFFARHFSRFIPGQPALIPQNMPGAAGIVMANSIATSQPNDGTYIAYGPGAIATADLLGVPGARYEASKFSYIGSMNADNGIAMSWHSSPIKTAHDAMQQELVVGAGGGTDQSSVFAIAFNRILGTKFKIVSGYPGTAALFLAMERGEISGIGGVNYSSLPAAKPDWLRDKKVNILLQTARERDEQLKDVPTVYELATTEEQRQILALIFSQSQLARLVFGPPAISSLRLKILRTAFDHMMKDPDFLEDARIQKIEINAPTSGNDIDKLVASLRTSKPEVIKKASEAIQSSN